MNATLLLLLFVGAAFAQRTTVETLVADGRFTTLVSLVTKAGLVGTLNNGTFTIFAPTDAAFAALPADVTAAVTSDNALLTKVLLYHVLAGSVPSSAASDELLVDTVNGAQARFNIYTHNKKITIQGCVVSQPDVMCTNGIIHVIDSVMMAPTGSLVDYVINNPQLSTLLGLVQQAGLVDALKADGLTLFAPNNAAFARLTQAQLDQFTKDPAVLAAILKYHVVASTEYSAGLYQREQLATLNTADSLVVHMVHHHADVKIDNGLVTSANNGVTNGVVHIVDHVLVPHADPIFPSLIVVFLRIVLFILEFYIYSNTGTHTEDTKMNVAVVVFLFVGAAFAQRTTVETLVADGRFTTLVSLVTKAGLVGTLNNGTFTIFAPTDAAFAALPADVTAAVTSDNALLTKVLLYHVLAGSVPSSAASDELLVDTVNGAQARFNIYTHNKKITIQGCVVSQPDVMCTNGIIHVIDSVMMAPTGSLVDYVINNPELSTLLGLVQQAGLVDALKTDGLTLFAPNNAAFARLSQAQLDQFTKDPAVLAAILKYHVVASTEYSAGLYQREQLATLNTADSLVVHMVHHQADVKIDNGLVTSANNGVTNGVVHIVDHVLVPHADPVVG
ncbi:BGH3-like protein [Mya arenaria]|uniref:BGH3-like protein n=1 Tax=Mya arenaria TaxID=6604 RepID=A0ABY7DMM1_MYAAR|nr:BGH3-like protein [Mya arenaria]